MNLLTDPAQVFSEVFDFASTYDLPQTPWQNGWHAEIPGHVTDGYVQNPYQSVDKNCCREKTNPYQCYP